MSQVVLISECFVQPKSEIQDSQKHHYFSPLALELLSLGNTQYGLLFKPSATFSSKNIYNNLQTSLSHALDFFYPLAGRFVTKKYEDEHSCSIFIDCRKGPGARLIHASALELSVADVAETSTDVPLVIQSFFDLGERQVNHDGHTRALLSLQLTELADGFFIGCCINHCIADGISLSHFLNILSQIFVSGAETTHVSRPPVFELPRSISESYPTLKLPFMEENEFITRFNESHLLRDRIFHFSASSMAKLKAKANAGAKNMLPTLSSYKALCGLIWRAITRARKLSCDEDTKFILTVNIRPRLNPPLSPDYFPNSVVLAIATAKVGELLTKDLGWATMLIHQQVEAVDDGAARKALVLSPGKSLTVEPPGHISFGANPIVMGGSPRFDFYGADFGFGKPVAVRTGYTNRDDGKLTSFPGCLGPNSVDLQVGIENMNDLLLDEEFMSYVSSASKS
ncbi:protein ENHANCED PSEUDOMONAS SUSCEPTIBILITY 1 [Beta vulgaris subsp. vulgaris]|uniref:protein ENHANCED PSEUDOMONAS SUSCEPTIBILITY 1 n=1 Tax=Beta vulgaris subsp. vulgaris TaxID=3555 RepID=UPI002548108E|nr:protein ENHANCED PSEUDOMONAS SUSCEPTIBILITY 1 [Beta vulgaris subsp. vulgaris]